MYPLPLAPENLTLPKEKTYFTLLSVLAAIAWLAITLSIVGLPYALLVGLMLWMLNGLLVAHLRAEGVRVTGEQFPELYQTYQNVLTRFNLKSEPEIYVIQSEGVLNAFATRHSGRDFVVIYSSILEAYGYDSPEIRFLIGHELGHVASKHILKRLFLAPTVFVPWVPAAYSRACEASSDRYGAYASGDIDGAISAMMTLSAGKMPAAKMSPPIFARQHFENRGFFVSWHELNSFYPTLSQRVSNLLAIKTGAFQASPGRHPLAYIFALFNFRNLVLIYILAFMAGMALPIFKKIQENAAEVAAAQAAHLDAAADDATAPAPEPTPTE